jgi:hypothetical protein
MRTLGMPEFESQVMSEAQFVNALGGFAATIFGGAYDGNSI